MTIHKTAREQVTQLETQAGADRKALADGQITLEQWQARAMQRAISYANLTTWFNLADTPEPNKKELRATARTSGS